MKIPPPLPSAVHKIATVDHLADGLVVAFRDGQEHVFPADLLYAVLPAELKLLKKLQSLRLSAVEHVRLA